MKDTIILLIILFLVGCQQENSNSASNTSSETIGDLDLKDYESILRHPVSSNNKLDSLDLAEINFKVKEISFDTIVMGEKAEIDFHFDNTGNNTLYILDTKVSCGCTITSYPRGGISAGNGGVISIIFDSTGKSGMQDRSIIVVSNGDPNETLLRIKGFIKQN